MTFRPSVFSRATICALIFCIASAGVMAQSPSAKFGDATSAVQPGESAPDVQQKDATSAVQPGDSTLAVLMDRLDAYINAIETESTATKITESDFLISACNDSVTRQKTALRLYERYMESPVMGDEAVAIHVFDTWFSDGAVKMPSDSEFFKARLFAELNRSSLIGLKAPELALRNPDGSDRNIPDKGDNRLKVLYFYDTDCPVCSSQTPLLKSVLNDSGIVLYAIYTGTEREKWVSYSGQNLDFECEVIHLWDPDRTSDFEMLYGVIRTPALFLLDSSGTIIGRRLDPASLGKLLHKFSTRKELEYGSDESLQVFGKIFAPIEAGMGCEGLSRMASHICDIALRNRDTVLFRQMTGDLLYFIAEQRGENYKCGTPDFVDKFILEKNEIWNTQDDSLKVIQLAHFLKNQAMLSPIGKKLPKVKVPAVEITPGKDGKPAMRNVRADLSGQKSAVVVFHLEDCSTCREKIKELSAELISEAGLHIPKAGKIRKILLIEMNRLWEQEQEKAAILSDNIDLTGIPMVIATDRRSRLSRKYL